MHWKDEYSFAIDYSIEGQDLKTNLPPTNGDHKANRWLNGNSKVAVEV